MSIGVALIGLGYWGPKLVKSLSSNSRARLLAVCDRHPENLQNLKSQMGEGFQADLLTDSASLFARSDIQLICITTQAQSHYELVERALLAGKDVLVEKPFTTSLEQATALVELAKKQKRRIFVDHIYLFSNDFRRFQSAAQPYLQMSDFVYQGWRCDYGLFAKDIGVLPLLLYHDLYMIDELWGLQRIESASGIQKQIASPWHSDFAKVALHAAPQVTLGSNKKKSAPSFFLEASLISPKKIRQISLSTSQGMLIWDDMQTAAAKIQFHSKQVHLKDGRVQVLDQGLTAIAHSDFWPLAEPLQNLWEHTLSAIQERKPAIHEGEKSLRIWRAVETLEKGTPWLV